VDEICSGYLLHLIAQINPAQRQPTNGSGCVLEIVIWLGHRMRTGGRTTDGEGTPTKERPTVRSQGLPRGPNFPSCMSRLVDSMGDGCETTRWDGRCSTSSVGRGGDVQITTRSRSWRLSATAKLAWAPPQHDYSDTPASSAHGVAEKPNWKCRDAFHRVRLLEAERNKLQSPRTTTLAYHRLGSLGGIFQLAS